MKKPNITEGPWRIEGQNIIGNEQNGFICTWSGKRSDAQAISALPNVARDYALLIHSIRNCKTDRGAVVLGDRLEKSIIETAKKMGFEL